MPPKTEKPGNGNNGGGGVGGGGSGSDPFVILGLTEGSDPEGDEITTLSTGFVFEGTLDTTAGIDSVRFVFTLGDNSVLEIVVDDGDPGTSLVDLLDAGGGSYTSGDWLFTLDATGAWTLTYTGSGITGSVQMDAYFDIPHPKNGRVQTKTAAPYTFEVAPDDSNSAIVVGTEDLAGGVTEDAAAPLSDTGTIAFSDADAGDTHTASEAFASSTHGTQLGTLEAIVTDQTGATGENGLVTWTFTASNEAVQFLGAGETIVETYTVTLTDGNGSTVTRDVEVTIAGVNDAAVIGVASGEYAVTEKGGVANGTDGDATASGILTVSDPDQDEARFAVPTAGALAGTYGDFTFDAATGVWSYALDETRADPLAAGAQEIDSLTVSSLDGTDSETINVTVNGANDAAVITSAGEYAVTEKGGVANGTDGDATASGDLDVTDADAGEAGFQIPASLAGTYGTFTFNATTGNWTYTLDESAADPLAAGALETDTLTVTSLDGTAHTIEVTVNGVNDAAVITAAGEYAVTEKGGVANGTDGDATASGDLDVTDADTGEAGFQSPASLSGTYGTFTFNATTGNWTYTLDESAADPLAAGALETDTLTVISLDGTAHTIEVTVSGVNDAAVITGTATGAVTEDAASNTVSAALSVADVDGADEVVPVTAGTAGDNGYGSFEVLADGTWTYTLDNGNATVDALGLGDTRTDTITVTSTDGLTDRQITVTIHGADESAGDPPPPDPIDAVIGVPDLLPGSDSGYSDSDDVTALRTGDYSVALISGAEVGHTVALTVNGLEMGSMVLDQADIDAGSVTFGGIDLGTAGKKTIQAEISADPTTPSGQATAVSGALVVDFNQSTNIISTIELLPSNDTGYSAYDNRTDVSQQTLRVYFNDFAQAGHYAGFYIDGALDGVIYQLEQSDIDQGYADLAIDGALSDGTHDIRARIGEATIWFGVHWSSNSEWSSTLELEIDTTPPVIAITEVLADVEPVAHGDTIADTTPTFSGTTDANTVVTLRQGPNILGTTQADATGAWTLTLGAALADKLHYVFAEAADEFGNASADRFLIRVDAEADPPPPPPELEPDFADMWHLAALGTTDGTWLDTSAIEAVWAEFSGAGVSVGVYDSGVEYDHVDLDDNYDWTNHATVDGSPIDAYPWTDSEAIHGTAVSGVIGAEANGLGTVGIAHAATLTGVNIFSGPAYVNAAGTDPDHGFYQVIEQQDRYDVVNHSWGGLPLFLDDDPSIVRSNVGPGTLAGFEDAVQNGRRIDASTALGTNVFKSAGNWADNANGNMADASRYSITVAAFDSDGDASFYTSRGANILITAPSSGYTGGGDLRIPTTDRQGEPGYVSTDWSTSGSGGFGGTSSAAPTAAAVATLMLEAAPGLGWRDVQDILAYSAMHLGSPVGAPSGAIEIVPVDADDNATYESTGPKPVEYFEWGETAGTNKNGGGLIHSGDYGFGAVNVHDAVRMAEVWAAFGPAQTSANEDLLPTTFANANPSSNPLLSVSGSGDSDTSSILAVDTPSGQAMELDTVDVTIQLSAWVLEEAELTITSPGGTTTTLLHPEINDYMALFTAGGAPVENVLNWTFGAHAFKGEDPRGNWTVTLTELDTDTDWQEFNTELDGIALEKIAFDFWGTFDGTGGVSLADDVYHYTDEVFDYHYNNQVLDDSARDDSRMAIEDTGGTDWLNMAAMTDDLTVDLAAGTASGAAGGTFLDPGGAPVPVIENAIGGDGNDALTGTGGANTLAGMRGNDTISAGGGTDDIIGFHGDDTLWGGADADIFHFGLGDGDDWIMDFVPDIDLVQLSDFASGDLSFEALDGDTIVTFLDSTDSISFESALVDPEDFLFGGVTPIG